MPARRTGRTAPPATHTCPGRCDTRVPNRYFACHDCWRILPNPLRRAVMSTAHLPLTEPRRAAAVTDAADWYLANTSGGAR